MTDVKLSWRRHLTLWWRQASCAVWFGITAFHMATCVALLLSHDQSEMSLGLLATQRAIAELAAFTVPTE